MIKMIRLFPICSNTVAQICIFARKSSKEDYISDFLKKVYIKVYKENLRKPSYLKSPERIAQKLKTEDERLIKSDEIINFFCFW